MWSRMHEKKSARALVTHLTKSCRSPLPPASRSVIDSSVFCVFPVNFITQTLNLFKRL